MVLADASFENLGKFFGVVAETIELWGDGDNIRS